MRILQRLLSSTSILAVIAVVSTLVLVPPRAARSMLTVNANMLRYNPQTPYGTPPGGFSMFSVTTGGLLGNLLQNAYGNNSPFQNGYGGTAPMGTLGLFGGNTNLASPFGYAGSSSGYPYGNIGSSYGSYPGLYGNSPLTNYGGNNYYSNPTQTAYPGTYGSYGNPPLSNYSGNCYYGNPTQAAYPGTYAPYGTTNYSPAGYFGSYGAYGSSPYPYSGTYSTMPAGSYGYPSGVYGGP